MDSSLHRIAAEWGGGGDPGLFGAGGEARLAKEGALHRDADFVLLLQEQEQRNAH